MEESRKCCRRCKRVLTPDEIGLTKKLVNRGSQAYYCLDCLAESFEVSRLDLEKKIQYFKDMGCTLFHQCQPAEGNL